jgi:hypothetical protein
MNALLHLSSFEPQLQAVHSRRQRTWFCSSKCCWFGQLLVMASDFRPSTSPDLLFDLPSDTAEIDRFLAELSSQAQASEDSTSLLSDFPLGTSPEFMNVGLDMPPPASFHPPAPPSPPAAVLMDTSAPMDATAPPAFPDVRTIQSLPRESLAPFQAGGPIPFPPTSFAPSGPAVPPSRLPLMPGANQPPVAQPQQASGFVTPWAPFWTACPLPFNPVSYPQAILPPTAAAEVPLCPPSSNPRAKKLAEKNKQSKPSGKPLSKPSSPSPDSAAPRSSKKDKVAAAELRAQLFELKSRLASRESESSALRNQLYSTEAELVRQKALLLTLCAHQDESPTPTSSLVTSPSVVGLPPTPPPTPARSRSPPRAAADIFNVSSVHKTRTAVPVDAFHQKIDFTNIELRKTKDAERIEAEKRKHVDSQIRWEQQHLVQAHIHALEAQLAAQRHLVAQLSVGPPTHSASAFAPTTAPTFGGTPRSLPMPIRRTQNA